MTVLDHLPSASPFSDDVYSCVCICVVRGHQSTLTGVCDQYGARAEGEGRQRSDYTSASYPSSLFRTCFGWHNQGQLRKEWRGVDHEGGERSGMFCLTACRED